MPVVKAHDTDDLLKMKAYKPSGTSQTIEQAWTKLKNGLKTKGVFEKNAPYPNIRDGIVKLHTLIAGGTIVDDEFIHQFNDFLIAYKIDVTPTKVAGRFTVSYAAESSEEERPVPRSPHIDPEKPVTPPPSAVIKKESGTDALPHMVKESKEGQTDVTGVSVGRDYIHIDDFNKARETMRQDFEQMDEDYQNQLHGLTEQVSRNRKLISDAKTVLANFDMSGDLRAHANAIINLKTTLDIDEFKSANPSADPSANPSVRATPVPQSAYESQVQTKLDIVKKQDAPRDAQESALNELKVPIEYIKKGKSTAPPIVSKSPIVTAVKPLQISKTALKYQRPEVNMKAFSLQDVFTQTYKKKVVW